MKDQYRTFINKDCDKTVFEPLFEKSPRHLKVGTDKHAFITDTLREVVGDLTLVYDNINLFQYDDWTGQELYEYISNEIGENNYMGAIETTEAQGNLMLEYVGTITELVLP
jgi:hypothetical protein